jgi:hypothetical protein
MRVFSASLDLDAAVRDAPTTQLPLCGGRYRVHSLNVKPFRSRCEQVNLLE